MLSHLSQKNRNSIILSHLGAIITVAIWGGSFVSTKVLLDHGMNPAEIYVYRFALAYVLILFMSHARLWANSVRDELLFALCGITGGTNVAAALRLARELGPGKRVVTILPDTAERYFSTPLFEND